MRAALRVDGRDLAVELARPVSLAIPVVFAGPAVRHFGAPAANAAPLVVGAFSGSVASGASCNCSTISLTPHCNGTHTECVAHLSAEPLDAWTLVPAGLVPAVLVTVAPRACRDTRESSSPEPRDGDRLVCREDLLAGWPAHLPFVPRALVVRTGFDPRDAPGATPPYLSREAATLLVERGIEHVVVDLPSLDRDSDEGRLTAHRVFFGLPPGSTALAAAARRAATVTELARVPAGVADGAWMLELQVPAIAGDAVPSRPLLYPVSVA